MSAKVVWYREGWWVRTHDRGKKHDRRVGPTKADKRAAERIAERINAAIALGQYDPKPKPEASTLPCDAALRRWHSTYAPTFKPTTEASSLGVIEHHLAPFFGSTDLGELREDDLLRFISAKLEEGLAPKTIANALGVLRRVINLAMREGRCPRNPAARIGELMRRVDRRLSTETTDVDYWTRPEADALIALAREHEPRFAPALVFAFSTG